MQGQAANEAMKSQGKKYIILLFVFLIISGLSVLFVYNYFGNKELFLSLGFLTVPVLLQMGALLLVYFSLDTLRFYYILRTFKIKIPFLYIMKLSFINMFVSAITPLATGGRICTSVFLK